MQFINLGAQFQLMKDEIMSEVESVFSSAQFIHGPAVPLLEKKLTEWTGSPFCVSCGNGTDALVLALRSLDIGPGDEVITSSFSFIAAAEAIALVGATPVFVDIGPRTFLIDAAKIEEQITPRTRAIIAVSLFGQVPEMDELSDICQKHHLALIEDGAQSFGATYKGRRSLSLSLISTTSFFPTKPLGCYGDGGAVFTQSAELQHKLQMLRNHGQEKKYVHQLVGYNSRLDTIQASILLTKLKYFSLEWEQRQKIAHRYDEALAGVGDLITPFVLAHNRSSYAQYSVLTHHRQSLMEALQKAGVPVFIHYPVPLHQQPCFAHLEKNRGNFAVTEKVCEQVLALPFGPYLSEEDQEKVISVVKAFYEKTDIRHPVL